MKLDYKDEGRVHVGVAVAPEVKRRLVDRAYARRVTVSDVLRSAIENEINMQIEAPLRAV